MPEKTIDAREMSSLPAMFFTQAERYSSEPFIWGKGWDCKAVKE